MSASEGNQADSHGPSDADSHSHGPPPPAEPHTPMWLPAVGALLFLTVGLAWALSTPSKEGADPAGMPAGTAAADAGAPAVKPAQGPGQGGGHPAHPGGH